MSGLLSRLLFLLKSGSENTKNDYHQNSNGTTEIHINNEFIIFKVN